MLWAAVACVCREVKVGWKGYFISFFMSLFYLVLRGGSKVSGREEHCCYMCPKVDFLQSEYFPDG